MGTTLPTHGFEAMYVRIPSQLRCFRSFSVTIPITVQLQNEFGIKHVSFLYTATGGASLGAKGAKLILL
jgi:hypothetical protein